MTQDVLQWKLSPFSLKGKAERWYMFAAGIRNGSWDNLTKRFSITFFKQNEKKTIGETWARFSLLVKSDPILSILNSLLLCTFYKSLDKDSVDYLNFITGVVSLHKIPAEGSKILDHIFKNTCFVVKSKPLREECESSHENLLAAESDPSPSISSHSAIEPSTEPGTSEGEETQPPKFPSQFEDDPSRNHKNTSNLIDAQIGKEPPSIHTNQSRNPLIEPSLRPTVPHLPPDPPNEAILKEAIKKNGQME
ncbi:hypothetical protein C2845_PM14G07880 [Panicum miliaceum]|uniref:Retrotransposon gag domain-containing protein n=1 Tax=Panicum miliaceum TaxID=4540 RepID=A0A3L6PT42_PANMI|nr:hypothetical protein C2845_PM14G07880 [Panicum miliaceum]